MTPRALLPAALLLLSSLACQRAQGSPSTSPPAEPARTVVRGDVEIRFEPYHQAHSQGTIFTALTAPEHIRLQPFTEPTDVREALTCSGAAINGSFYDDDGQPLGLVRIDGREIQPLSRGGGSGVLVQRPDGTLELLEAGALRSGSISLGRTRWALQSIDRLVDEGQNLVADTDARDARSAVALLDDGRVLLVSVIDERALRGDDDGVHPLNRKSTSTGLTLHELAELLINRGAVQAINLDGGYSTAFVTRDRGVTGYRGTINALVACP